MRFYIVKNLTSIQSTMKNISVTLLLFITSTVVALADNWGKADIGMVDDYDDGGGDSMWFWIIIIGIVLLGAFIKGIIDGSKK